MRFSLAIGILSQTSALASASKSSNNLRRKAKSALQFTPNNDNGSVHYRKQGQGVHRYFHSKLKNGRPRNVIKNPTDPFADALKECDPGDGADVGILGCGENEYCVESEDSTIGGICTSDRSLQLVALAPEYCDPTSSYYASCDCTEFDVDLNQGSILCTPYEYYCVSYNLCGSVTIGTTITEDDLYSGEICYNFVTPYELPVCYLYDTTPSCSISVGNVECNSCETVDVTDAYGTAYGCFQFDCTNTVANLAGNDCMGDFVLEALSLRFSQASSVPATSFEPSGVPDIPPPTPIPTSVPMPTEPPVSDSSLLPSSVPGVSPSEPPGTDRPSPVPAISPAPVTDSPVTGSPATSAPVTTDEMTSSPTTQAPVSNPPTTRVPSTDAPITSAPVTAPPSTNAPSTSSPTTSAPITPSPITAAPTTAAPVSPSPTTQSPVIPAPITAAPTTLAPITPVPTTLAPITPAPITPAPTTNAPVTLAPVTKSPETSSPTTGAPVKTAVPATPSPISESPSELPSSGPTSTDSMAPSAPPSSSGTSEQDDSPLGADSSAQSRSTALCILAVGLLSFAFS